MSGDSYVTLSESADELAVVAASHGWSLDGIEIFELMPDEDALRPDAQYTVFHPSEVELTSTTQAIFEIVERVKPVRVVFDSLSELRLLARDSLRYRRQILGFKHFFTHHQATVLLLDDRTGEDADLAAEESGPWSAAAGSRWRSTTARSAASSGWSSCVA